MDADARAAALWYQAFRNGGLPPVAAPSTYGAYWGPVIEPVVAALRHSRATAERIASTPGMERMIAPLIAEIEAEAPAAVPDVASYPVLPSEAVPPLHEALSASRWLNAYIAHSQHWSPRSYPDFHESVGWWLLSVIAARRIVVHFGKPTYTPLMIALAGRTSLHAKTTAVEVGIDVLRTSGLDWLLLESDSATPQKYIQESVQRLPDDWTSQNRDEQRITEQRVAFAGQHGWWYDEFGQMLHKMASPNSPMSEFSGLLRRFDDCPSVWSYGTVGRGNDRIRQPYLALLASLTPTDLKPMMRRGSAAWADGFWARFAFVTPPDDSYRKDPFPPGERRAPLALTQPLHAWHTRLGSPDIQISDKDVTVGPLPVETCTIDQSIIDPVHGWYYRYNNALLDMIASFPNDDLSGCYARFPIKTLRLAALLASLENNGHIEVRHWARAWQTTERWRASLHYLYTQTNGMPTTDKRSAEDAVLEKMTQLHMSSVADLANYIKWLSRGEIEDAAKNLVASGLAEAVPTSHTVKYRPTQPVTTEEKK